MLKQIILTSIRRIFRIQILEQLLVLFTIDQKYGGWMKIFVPNNDQYPYGTIRVCVRNGVKYELDLADLMDWYIYFGFREIEKNNFFKSIRKGDVIFDVGANLGQFTIHSALATGRNGMVYSFEPYAPNFAKLKKNLELNACNNVIPESFGLGESPMHAEIKIINPHNYGMNKIEKKVDGTIKIETMDNYVFMNNIEKIDKIKIDTEGYEFLILKGGKSILEKFHPHLFIEIDDKNLKEQNCSPAEVFSFLQLLQYKILYANTMTPVNFRDSFLNCHFDIIAV